MQQWVNPMVESLPERLEKALQRVLAPGERIVIKIRGAFKEALICTEMRVIILKCGWMTGQLFGTSIFQFPYSNLAGAQVNFGFVTGYFELSAGGMQNSPKSFWKSDAGLSATKAANCIAIAGKPSAEKFGNACTFIMQRVCASHRCIENRTPDEVSVLQRLGRLRNSGLISQAVFEAKRAEILGRL